MIFEVCCAFSRRGK